MAQADEIFPRGVCDDREGRAGHVREVQAPPIGLKNLRDCGMKRSRSRSSECNCNVFVVSE